MKSLAILISLTLILPSAPAAIAQQQSNTAQQSETAEHPETAQQTAVAGDSTTAEQTKIIESLDTFIEETRQTWQVPGLAVAIVKDDQVVLAKGYGVRQADSDAAVDGDTLFAIASNSKAFTAAGLAILVDEGRIGWDDPVGDYLPWLRLQDPLATSELTIRDLLCHRSGLGTFSGDLVWWGTDYSPRELLTRARHLKPASSFRSEYGYSNLMFVAAGLVIEEVSGQDWGTFIKHRILDPLEMNRTITSVRDLVSQGNFASPHKTYQDHSQPIDWMNWDTMAAAGGIISSANDMAQWLRLQLNRGSWEQDQRLFSEQQSRSMWTAQMAIPVSAGYNKLYPSTHFRAYGLGWSMSDYLGRKIVGHGGGYDGMYSQVLMVPEENLGIVVLTNSMTGISPVISYQILETYLTGTPTADRSEKALESFWNSRQQFEQRIIDATTPAVADTNPSHPLVDYTGTFRSPLYGDVKIEKADEGLVLRMVPHHDLVADLEHLHYDTFVIRWRKDYAWFAAGTANFIANAKAEVVKVELDVPNDDLWFYELELQRVKQPD